MLLFKLTFRKLLIILLWWRMYLPIIWRNRPCLSWQWSLRSTWSLWRLRTSWIWSSWITNIMNLIISIFIIDIIVVLIIRSLWWRLRTSRNFLLIWMIIWFWFWLWSIRWILWMMRRSTWSIGVIWSIRTTHWRRSWFLISGSLLWVLLNLW